ncbi:MAG: hypothetical protein M1814_002108 [Vezdaea aestivalis]|nr:MAG: hypothetical protein M1814_002108 [Vezdaea aestivalis]
MTLHGLPYKPESLYYDGKVQAPSGEYPWTIEDPSTAQPLVQLIPSSTDDVDKAMDSAQKAFLDWSGTCYIERSRILRRAAEIIRKRNDELAEVETRNTGRPFSETSAVDIPSGADVLEFYANLVGSGGLNGETTRLRDDAWVYTTKEPLGVCVGIGAWNYPLQIALWKSAPCLAAGNTMIYKPSEFTPLHGAELAAIYTEAGLPPGVFNVINGNGSIGDYAVRHERTAKVSFTGQVSTGQKVASAAGLGTKYTTMELGGKSALIVCGDAPLELAVDAAMMANFYSTGQVCANGTRVFVPESRKAAFEVLLLNKMQFIRMGDPMDPATNFGPLANGIHFEKVRDYLVHGSVHDKATLLCGGSDAQPAMRTSDDPKWREGFWIDPTVFTDCHDDMKIVQEEIFGPVLCILTYKTIEEAVKRANATNFGLAAGVITSDINQAHRIVSQLQAGITWINSWGESPAEMSVGGWKLSGLGVENGQLGIEAWVQNKSTLVDMSGQIATVFAET